MSDSNKLVLTAIIGILVGLVLGRLLWYSKTTLPDSEANYNEATTTDTGVSEQEAPAPTATETPAQPPIESAAPAPSSSSVSAENQPAGSSAEVSVTADQAVWVVVRDDNQGVMGKILGAKHVAAGNANVTVPLQRATETGISYFVALVPYNDGTLSYAVSAVLKDASGQPVAATFSAE